MIKGKPVIALLAPIQNAYSETFIHAHKNYLNGEVKYFFGDWPPDQLEGFGYLSQLRANSFWIRMYRKVLHKINPHTIISPAEWKLRDLKAAFLQNKINIAFAEYGPMAAECLPVCKELKIPLIVHFHGFDASVKETLEHYARSYQEVFQYASAIVSVSNRMNETLLKLGANPDKLVYNPYGPNDLFFSVNPVWNKKIFLALGRFVEKKAPYLTLMAFKDVLEEHPDAVLCMGGDGPLIGVCLDLTEAWGIKDRVCFLGELTSEQVRENMANALAFVQHSVTAADGDSEGAPVAILEAEAAGLPIVATRHAGIPDIVIENETGFLVDEKDVSGMAACMSKLASNTELAKQMGYNARKRIRENFTMEKHISKLNELIEKALAEE